MFCIEGIEAGIHCLCVVKAGSVDSGDGNQSDQSGDKVQWVYGLLARTDTSRPNSESCSIFFFDADTPGFSIGTIENKMGFRASINGELIFEDMRLSKDHLLGQEGGGFETINAIYAVNGVGSGAMSVGIARAAYDMATAYAQEREIWGRPIGKYQEVGNLLVDMNTELEMARLMVRRIAWQAENKSSEGALPPGMAKVYPAEMARRVTVNTMQILGGPVAALHRS